jgi:hypothetical protein
MLDSESDVHVSPEMQMYKDISVKSLIGAPTKSETGAPTKKADKPLSQKTVAPIIPTKTPVQSYSLPENPATFISNISNMDDAAALKLLKSVKADAVKRYGGSMGADIDTMISRLTPATVQKSVVVKTASITDVYNKLSKVVNIDSANPNPSWKRMDINKLDSMVKNTDREQLLTALTNILSRAGNKNPRVTAENIIKNYTRMVGK